MSLREVSKANDTATYFAHFLFTNHKQIEKSHVISSKSGITNQIVLRPAKRNPYQSYSGNTFPLSR
jgi:hypothetical protein